VAPGLRDDNADVRRLRAGFEFDARRLSGEFVVDLADLANRALGDDSHQPAFTAPTHLKNAYLEFALTKRHFLRAGNFKLPVSREFLTSAAKTDFMERSLIANGLGVDRDLGVMAGGKFGVAHGLTYQAGIFAGDGWGHDARAGTTGAARVVFEPLAGLELGVNGSLGTVTAAQGTNTYTPPENGLHGETATEWKFFHRKYVDGQRWRLGGDAMYVTGPLTFKGEMLAAHEERKLQGPGSQDLPPVHGLGGSAVAVWRVHGFQPKKESKKESKKSKKHARHVVDLALRYEWLGFDDDGPNEGFENLGSRASNVRPASCYVLTGGVSYEPRPWVRVMGNVLLESYSDALTAPEPGRKGPYVTTLLRLQLAIP
jgi:phosphate-selective porin